VSSLPTLYSFRRCPYAIRTRMAIAYSGIPVELREVVLKDKPAELLQASPKATVPVLILPNGTVLDESRDIMHWALNQHDPNRWLKYPNNALIHTNDESFKSSLDCYKYAERFPEQDQKYYRSQAEVFLQTLESRLEQQAFLTDDDISITDIAIFPFIRQFAHVDLTWFEAAPYPQLQRWLQYHLQSKLFLSVMQKYPAWQPSHKITIFP